MGRLRTGAPPSSKQFKLHPPIFIWSCRRRCPSGLNQCSGWLGYTIDKPVMRNMAMGQETPYPCEPSDKWSKWSVLGCLPTHLWMTHPQARKVIPTIGRQHEIFIHLADLWPMSSYFSRAVRRKTADSFEQQRLWSHIKQITLNLLAITQLLGVPDGSPRWGTMSLNYRINVLVN